MNLREGVSLLAQAYSLNAGEKDLYRKAEEYTCAESGRAAFLPECKALGFVVL